MGLGLPEWVVRDADYYPTADVMSAAVPDDLKISMFFGLSDLDKARRDFAEVNDGRLLPYVGTPVAAANYLTGDGATNYLRSGEIETPEFTVCMTLKSDDTQADSANRGTLFGSFGGLSFPGCLAYWENATTLRFQVYQGAGTVRVCTLTPSPTTTLRRYTFKCTSVLASLINATDNVADTETITAARQVGVLPINIFSSQSTSFLGSQGAFTFHYWARAITAPEEAAHWGQVLAHATKRGVALG